MSRPRLPPLNAIKAFEAAARLGSFTRAADELNVTHGAVSRQIRLLEDWLGVRLFLRTGRNAVPTQAGTELLAEAGPALDRLAAVSRRMQNRGRARGLLHVSALPTFAMRWLIPPLPDFQRNHPGLELRLASLLSLGAIDFGIVGDSIVMTKAILRLREAKPDEPHTEDGILCPHHPSPAHKSPRDFLRARPRSPTQPP